MSNPSGLPEFVFVPRDSSLVASNVLATVEGELGQTLAPADPRRLFTNAIIALLVQARSHINITGRQNLLAYAYGDALSALGQLVLGDDADHLPASPALTTIRFALSAARASATPIASGRLIGAGSVLFETLLPMEIPAGQLTGDVVAKAVVAGSSGNDFIAGQINALVEPIPFVASAVNITTSQGGAPEETDDAYRDRIRSKPGSFSVAGPESAYQYWAKSASSAIADVSVMTNAAYPGRVYIRPLLQDGAIPGAEVLALVLASTSARTRRPLTDFVQALAPTAVACNVDFSYWVDADDAGIAETIQANVAAAVTKYRAWQRAKLGRAINPDRLRSLVIAAGAKRMVVSSPSYQALTQDLVAQDGSLDVTYGGVEDA